jgi:hypothetical protein
MSELPRRFDHVRRSAGWGGLFALAGVAALCIVGGYLLAAEGDLRWGHLLLGIGVIAFGLVLAAGYMFLKGLIDLALKIEGTTFRLYDAIRDLQAIQRESKNLEVVGKLAAFRCRPVDCPSRSRSRPPCGWRSMRRLSAATWRRGHALVEQLEGAAWLSQQKRPASRKSTLPSQEHACKVHEAVEQVRRQDRHDGLGSCPPGDGPSARDPENDEVKEFAELFAAKRGEHKRRLLKGWDESVQRNEVDRGIAILKQLDQYLTRNEAAALEESARGVFRTKLHNLGLQFSFAVAEHNWRDALAVGRQIMEEFPNTRMAQEVRERIHVLSQRADDMSTEVVEVGASQG